MARLTIDDGYTLPFSTPPVAGAVVSGTYRPALARAYHAWEFAFDTARSGEDKAAATAKLVADHLCTWDVTVAEGATERPAPITADVLLKLPPKVLDELFQVVTSWKPKGWEADAGNS